MKRKEGKEKERGKREVIGRKVVVPLRNGTFYKRGRRVDLLLCGRCSLTEHVNSVRSRAFTGLIECLMFGKIEI